MTNQMPACIPHINSRESSFDAAPAPVHLAISLGLETAANFTPNVEPPYLILIALVLSAIPSLRVIYLTESFSNASSVKITRSLCPCTPARGSMHARPPFSSSSTILAPVATAFSSHLVADQGSNPKDAYAGVISLLHQSCQPRKLPYLTGAMDAC